MTALDRATATRALDDASVFAEALIGQPLWPHQREVLASPARFRCILAGRQCGKSRTLAVAALHEAFRDRGRRVLILSAGEEAAKRLLAEIAALSAAPLLRGSVTDEGKSLVTLSNGSTILSVPASEKQIRGQSVDLLILDEACQIAEEIWTAAKWTIIARPGSRIIMASTPYGRQDRFFAVTWRAGEKRLLHRPVEGHASWRWPSTVSPLVDQTLLDMWRSSAVSDREYRQEVLAEWVDEAGSYFPTSELEAVTADYQMIDPATADGDLVIAGVDFGFSTDANAITLLGALDDGCPDGIGLNDQRPTPGRVYFVAWCEENFSLPYSEFARRIIDYGDYRRGGWNPRPGFSMLHVLAEMNGPGTPVVQQMRDLAAQRWASRYGIVGVNTTAAYKENLFAQLRLLIQQGRLVLPRHQGLLRQLNNLEFTTSDSGHLKIAVPERLGHDDLAMSLAQCMAGVKTRPRHWWPILSPRSTGEVLETPSGTRIHARPRCLDDTYAFTRPRGGDARDEF